MTDSALAMPLRTLPDPRQPLGPLVRIGLAHYWSRVMPHDPDLVEPLLLQAATQLGEATAPDWLSLRERMASQLPHLPGPFGRWVREQRIDLAQAFLLALVGSAETDYMVTLCLAELQAPNPGTRLAVHLALSILDELFGAGHLDALDLQASPLLQLHLLRAEGSGPLSLRQLRLEPALWSVLCGRAALWPGTRALPLEPRELLPLQIRQQLPHLATLLTRGEVRGLVIRGHSSSGRRALAAELAQLLALQAVEVSPTLWQSEPALALACQLGGWLPVIRTSIAAGDSWQLPPVQPNIPHVVVLGMTDAVAGQDMLEVEVGVPAEAERYALWQRFLTAPDDPAALSASLNPAHPSLHNSPHSYSPHSYSPHNQPPHQPHTPPRQPAPARPGAATAPGHSDAAAGPPVADDTALARRAATALLSGPVIQRLARTARLRAGQAREVLDAGHIAQARRDQGAERLRLLAHPVTRQVPRTAIVFPPLVEQNLSDFIERAHHRESLWQDLGATLQASRNPGLRALFVGDSGTGKTLAASYVATALGAPLYRVDLAAIMNKYVGESEKNLGTLLDLAAAADAMLLFDEADSLFGRRTDAKQSGERYANMLTNFLLTRIENHPGIVILTTNSRERIDSAFTRRLDTIIDFPLPGFGERLALWHSHLGRRSPGEALCKTLASYCDLSGGQIRNVVLTAASSGEPGDPMPVVALMGALQREYQKLGRNLPAQLDTLRGTS